MRNCINPLNFITIENFKRRFRFSKDFVKYGILPKLKNEIVRDNNYNLLMSPLHQLLICLRFYAIGNFQVSI